MINLLLFFNISGKKFKFITLITVCYMGFGFYNFGDKSEASSRRRGSASKYSKGTAAVESDLSRLFLLSFMLLAAIFGGYYNSVSNIPSRIIKKSIDKSLKHSFRASLEGSTSLKNSILSTYRSHQKYNPEEGHSILPNIGSSDRAPFDAVSAMESILHAENAVEYGREDMYGHGTRLFSGSLKFPGDDDSVACVFKYWIDIRSHLAVRLHIAKVERNVSTFSDGEPASRETYINIRYHDWH